MKKYNILQAFPVINRSDIEQKIPEMNVSESVDKRSAQTFYTTPSKLGEPFIQRQQG